ncbi:MAG: glutamine--fructose-6-phosphate transaminase (isomerizing) [Elusimicrobiota bacterium]|jgi:glucosamine--fructose-6-phosphate aminotransferase (isomerizing)|nr:glutamine--fructose-6-phosphate transaminase (isomerizing) [Elusimicrobiota bacterium]
MCGIVGYIGSKDAVNVVFKGLEKLEYRGYDSAGIAALCENEICIRRSVGKLANLKKNLLANHIHSNTAIGHTRWATHGKPSEENAHPHTDSQNNIVIVHNGIIENYIELKNDLHKEGRLFKSETDTEVLAHLIERYYDGDLFCAVQKTLSKVRGSYALCVLCKHEPDKIICARKEVPLILGIGTGENFIASDIPALLPYTRDMVFLENGDIAQVNREKIAISDILGKEVQREKKHILWDALQAEKDGYKHFMLKEIFEQPRSVEDTFRGRIYPNEGKVYIEEIKLSAAELKKISKIYIVACGTSYHAGLTAKFWFEKFAKIPTEVEIASEFRYREPILDKNVLVLVISQSGETADTLAALRLAKENNCQTIAVCNSIGSSMSRESANTIYTHCGPEIGVASTKAFTGQLCALYILALDFAEKKGTLCESESCKYIVQLWEIPLKISAILKKSEYILKIAKELAHKKTFLFLGRHLNYSAALEGALKLKEISYLHAEGYAAGEMKHGPIALIDENMPIIAIAVKSRVYEKIISNIEEAKARGGAVIAIVNDCCKEVEEKFSKTICIPESDDIISPMLTIIPLQLLAYYISTILGCDVDQPRNLAKSVTVE